MVSSCFQTFMNILAFRKGWMKLHKVYFSPSYEPLIILNVF